MPLVPLKIPPGVYRNGTEYESKGRWFDTNLVRWFESALQPVGGWREVIDSGTSLQVDVTDPVRGMHGWRADDGTAYLAFGTFQNAYAFHLGVLTDITPAGFTAGTKDATVTSGGAYGEGIYGEGPYGGVVSDTTHEIIEAGSWQFDNYGERLIGVAFPDATIYEWDLNVLNNFVAVTNAPTANAVVVTEQGHIMALGAAGDRRLVQWSDSEDRTDWTSTEVNEAGDHPLSGAGEAMAGRRFRGQTLVWTDKDLWSFRYVGGELVFNIVQVGQNCGAISRHSMALVDSRAFWMSKRGFHTFDGHTEDLPSEVGDYVFGDFNWIQQSKVAAVSIAEFGEVWWFYPSAGSNENDRYVFYNYEQNIWGIGDIERTSGWDRGPQRFPLMFDASGQLWTHEDGYEYPKPTTGSYSPHAESGPVEIGDAGDRVMFISAILPDSKNGVSGDVSAIIFLKFEPDGAETSTGTIVLTERTDVRHTARMARLRLTEVNDNWRVGVIRLDVTPAGRR